MMRWLSLAPPALCLGGTIAPWPTMTACCANGCADYGRHGGSGDGPRGCGPSVGSVFESHPFLHAGTLGEPVAPSGHILQTDGVEQRLARGIDRIDREISEGQLSAGKIGGARELSIGCAEEVCEPVLVKLDHRA